MSIQLSKVAEAAETRLGGHFSAFRLNLDQLAGFAAPIIVFDHFHMSGRTFSPHPHAGFSAITYVFEDSAGALRSRDSLGNDQIVQPGDLIWAQAGRGIIHDEFPATNGAAVHGLQMFVNLGSKNKHNEPQIFHGAAAHIPALEDEAGNRTRVLSGQYAGVCSPLMPAEPFQFFDVRVQGPWGSPVKGAHNALVYVLDGEIDVLVGGSRRRLSAHQAVAMRADTTGGELAIVPRSPAHLLLLSGQDHHEPVAVYGPFIMNTQDELAAAYERYRSGQMGRLTPV